ncbi:hypothetical protein J2I47_15310 [Fibrella sp. HMF5335]|uniref:Uncharacterized protein n=1 Tax=Fibrella rubiginis TaxID=2817060 RepID=A0A939GFA4_9BACT|nr:hypothetical protein [Fibrella rubiginis]MBO0937924.1 hypothetical protein [Fibrella rubiginis]
MYFLKDLLSSSLAAGVLFVTCTLPTPAQWQQGPVQTGPSSSRPTSNTALQKVDTLNRRYRANQFDSAPRRVGMSRIDTVRGRR